MDFYLPAQITKIDTKEQWAINITSSDVEILAGCGIPFTRLEDKEVMVQAIIKHSCIFSVKAELDQIREGMDLLRLLGIFKRYPKAFLPLFLQCDKVITAVFMQDLFRIPFSPMGSNIREREETTSLHWIQFLNDVEAGLLSGTTEGNQFDISLGDILFFATGSTQVPPMGFDIQPSIEFPFEQLPRASTCANVLELPLIDSYEDFKDTMCFAISNTVGFECI